MKIRLTIVVILLITTHSLMSQPNIHWIRLYENDGYQRATFNDIFRNADNSYTLAGTLMDNQRGWDVWLVRVSDNGETLFNRSYGNRNLSENARSVIQTDDNGFVTVGIASSFVNNVPRLDMYAIRTDAHGEQLWYRNYGGEESYEECSAVIETKAGNFLLAGWTNAQGSPDGYLIMINGDGDVIWDNPYGGEDRQELACIRETENEFVVGGMNGESVWIIKVDINGEIIWSQTHNIGHEAIARNIVSCPDGGFALGCKFISDSDEDYAILRIDQDGIRQWIRILDVGEMQRQARTIDIWRMEDNGFVVVASNGRQGATVRTDAQGNEQWRRHNNFEEIDEIDYAYLNSVVIDQDNSIITAGMTSNGDNEKFGMLYKLVPEFSAPEIFSYTPEMLELNRLVQDSVTFLIRAVDLQGDSISYLWTKNSDTASTDTSVTVIFNELGTDTIDCTVSDGELADSIRWIVHVKELYIDSYSPPILNLPIRRNSTIDFSVSTRAVEDNPVEYLWLLNDEQVADDDSVSIRFERGREHSVTAVASQGDLSDSVTWQVMVNDLIVDYMPEQFELTVPIDTTFEFEVFPFDPNDDSLRFTWTVNGDSVWNRSWLLKNFDEEGMYSITAYVSDAIESDSLTWEVNVQPDGVYADEPRHPETTTLHPPVPNPFNSHTRISYSLPMEAQIDLGLYDISGRRVATLYSGVRAAGVWSAAIDGSDLSSGVYFLGMSMGEERLLRKVVLVK